MCDAGRVCEGRHPHGSVSALAWMNPLSIRNPPSLADINEVRRTDDACLEYPATLHLSFVRIYLPRTIRTQLLYVSSCRFYRIQARVRLEDSR